jgi:hypothetical protein
MRTAMSTESASDFDSAAKLLEYLRANFPQQLCEVEATRHRWGQPDFLHSHSVKKYIFRGERGDRPTTVSSWERLEGTSLDEKDKNQLNNLVGTIADWLSSDKSGFKLNQPDAYGLVQHLGLPTHYIDFTGNPEVAIAFAVGGPESSSKKVGRVCVLEVPAAITRGQVAEFCNARWCVRAERQVAYGYSPLPKCGDLKSPQAKADHGVVGWFEFTIQPDDRVRLGEEHAALLKTSTDPVAGLLRHRVNCYVAENGKLRTPVVDFCARKVPMVPLVGRLDTLSDGQQEVVFLPPCAPPDWNEGAERKCSLRYWSEGFRETLGREYFSTPRPDSSGIWVHAATYHPFGRIDVNLLRGGD